MSSPDVTQLLLQARDGDAEAANQLGPLVYDELKRRASSLMRREANAHTVQATMLVTEAFMSLVDGARVDWESRNHFFALASKVMRRVLVDHARARSRLKRGGDVVKVELDEAITIAAESDQDVLQLEEALEKLEQRDPMQAQIVTLRFYGGLSMQAVADTIGMPKRSVEREWTMIKAWLRREMSS